MGKPHQNNSWNNRITSYNVCYTKLLRDLDWTIAAYDPAAGTYDHKAEDMPNRFIASRLLLLLFTALIISFPSDSRSQPMSSLKEIRENGIVMQKWEKSCAAATIATVLTYGFHDPVSERYAAAKMLEKTDPTKVKLVGGFVITSYSIHYTKLYEINASPLRVSV